MATADRRNLAGPDVASIRAALDCGRPGCACSRGPNTHCPGPSHARGDRQPSLTVHERDGKALVNCKGACDQASVISELQAMGLWPRRTADVVPFSPGRAERTVGRPPARLIATTIDQIRTLDDSIEAEHVRQDFEDGEKNCYWKLPDGRNGLGGRKVTTLPLFGMELLPEVPSGATVLVCEGEKATKAARQLGLVAVGTVTGAGTHPDDDILRHLIRFDTVLWPDHDTKGRQHMDRIAERLTALGGHVRLLSWGEREKDDAADFVERGGTAEEAAALIAGSTVVDPLKDELLALPIVNAADLAVKVFVEPKVIVPKLLVEGATLLVSPGKSGKSRLVMGVAVAVAHGGVALGSIDVEGGDVLYLALEDGMRRGQSRMLAACGGGSAPSRLDLAFEWQTMDKGGLTQIETWLRSHPAARLVIIDTLKRFRATTDGRRNAYDVDYEALAPINDLALRYGVCIVVVHHTNKIKLSDDPTDRASGSTGMLAAVDGMIVMERTRGKADAVLHVFHRDLEDGKYAIKSDPHIGWSFLGEADEHVMTDLQGEIADLILDGDTPLRPSDVAAALGRDRKDIGTSMWRMAKPDAHGRQALVSRGGYYWPASKPWPSVDDDDEAPSTRPGRNREDLEREGGEREGPVALGLPWDGAERDIAQPAQPGGTDAIQVTGATGGESHSLEGTEWKECDGGQESPVTPVAPVPRAGPRDAHEVTPPRGSNLTRARDVWRCQRCRALEHLTLPDGSERCLGCAHVDRRVRGAEP